MILFRRVRDEHGWFSNMSPHPLGEWRTAEAYFQAKRFTDGTVKEEIRLCTSPMGAKMIAKRHAEKMVIAPRSIDDLRLMSTVLVLKLYFNPELEKLLQATGDEVIVEDVSNRQNESGLFWGAVVKDGAIIAGQNHLGRLWMELRAEIKALRNEEAQKLALQSKS